MRSRLRAVLAAAVLGTATFVEAKPERPPPGVIRMAPDHEGLAERLRAIGLRFKLHAVR